MATDIVILQQALKGLCPLSATTQWHLCPLAWLREQVGLRDWPPHRDAGSLDRPWEHLPVEPWRRTSTF